MSLNPIHQETVIGDVSIIQEQQQIHEVVSITPTDSEKNDRIMKKLEEEGEKVAKQFITGNADNINTLTSFMNYGSKRFQETVGRPMTYGEMRAMWG
jgi:hypothetical protein